MDCVFLAVTMALGAGQETLQHATFRTNYQASPVTIPGPDAHGGVTAFELEVEQLADDSGAGTLVLDHGKPEFDEFGEVSVVQLGRKKPHRVKLMRIPAYDRWGVGRQLYKLEFPDRLWRNRIYFAWSPTGIVPHRLLIRAEKEPKDIPADADDPESDFMVSLSYILPMSQTAGERGTYELTQPLPDRISFYTDHFLWGPPEDRSPRFIHIYGDPRDKLNVSLDGNLVSFRPLGDVGRMTLRYYGAVAFRTKEPSVERIPGDGRRIYDLALDKLPNAAITYRLVLADDLGGPHRLIVRKNGEVRHVLRLFDHDWLEFARRYQQLATVSKRERRAIDVIRQRAGLDFSFSVTEHQVTQLRLRYETGNDVSMACLNHLPHLRSLGFDRCVDITETAYSSLENLEKLEKITFHSSPVNDGILEQVRHLKRLRHFGVYDNNPSAHDARITNHGLEVFAQLSMLETIHIHSDRITDEGLRHLANLQHLRKLDLRAARVTPTGLAQLWDQPAVEVIEAEAIPTSHEKYGYTLQLISSTLEAKAHGAIDNEALRHIAEMRRPKRLQIRHADSDERADWSPFAKAKNVESLSLESNDAITDSDLQYIGQMTGLKDLDLDYCAHISNDGLKHLRDLGQLQSLGVARTKVDQAGVEELQRHLPDCKIVWQNNTYGK